MGIKYNRSLDLMAAAVEFLQAGKFNSAAKALATAAKDPSIKAALAIVEASNSKAHAKLQASRKVKAADFDTAIDSDEPGEELRMDLDENDDRIVQESSMDDDMDDDLMEASADEETDEDEDEVEKAEAALKAARSRARAKAEAKSKPTAVSAQARLAQAMKNFEKLK